MRKVNNISHNITYILLIANLKKQMVFVGRIGKLKFDKGYYVYLGSAHKNILQRIKRHLSNYKKKFWHIDYLLMGQGVKVKEVWVGSRKNECEMALCFIENRFQYAKKFGSSDCECPSHLFMVDENISKVKNTLRKNGFRKLNL